MAFVLPDRNNRWHHDDAVFVQAQSGIQIAGCELANARTTLTAAVDFPNHCSRPVRSGIQPNDFIPLHPASLGGYNLGRKGPVSMVDSSQPVEKPVKRKLRWYQFSLRSLLIFVTLFAVACSWFAVKMGQAKRQREAIQVIQKAGGNVAYDYEETAPRTRSSSGKPWEPEWLSKLLSEDFFHDPVYFSLSGSPKDEGWLKAVNSLPSLKTLLLWSENISNQTLDHLAELPNHEELHLTGSSVTDQGLKNMSKFPKLRWLVMNGTRIGDSGVAYLRNPIILEELVLTDTRVSDAAIPDLSSMTTLQLLDVRRTAITASGCKELKKALPNCDVMWQAKKPSKRSPSND
jgi:hypothetical protein